MTPAPAKVRTIRDALAEARRLLAGDEAALEAEVLLMHTLRVDRARVYQALSHPLTAEQSATYAAFVARRAEHEPLAYITGRREFFGLEFEVSPAVLIPRPETETLVELVVAFARETFSGGALTIADVGTGSGAIAVSLASALPNARVIATDVSSEAVAIAHRNAERHSVAARIDFREGDLLSALSGRAQVIAANLPYVTTEQWQEAPPEIRDHEPRVALDGGVDGLDMIRRLLTEAPERLTAGGALFCEIGYWQGNAARELARTAFPEARVDVARDLAGRDRVIAIYA